MNTQNKESTNLSKSSASESVDNGVSQRAHEIFLRNHEYKNENEETTIVLKIPKSLQGELRKLGSFLGLSTESILLSSIQYVISYIEDKKVEITKIDEYSTFKEDESYKDISVELSGKVFEKLQQQSLLDSASNFAILGFKILYSQLIEAEIDFDKVG